MTYSHPDHIGALRSIKEMYSCCVEPVITIQVIGAPGHPRESLCFYYREQKILFTGDSIPELSDALIHEGLSRIFKIRGCTEGYRGGMGKESTQRLFELICEACNMAEYKKNPLFMRSVISDLSRLNQGNHMD